MSEYKIFRFREKNYNRPPSPTYVRQVDFSLDFSSEPMSGNTIFHIPRHNTVIKQVDRQHGFPLDFGLDWSKSKLSIKNPLIDWSFFDELSANLEDYPEGYYPFLKRDYYIHNNKGERWKVGLSADWTAKYAATISWEDDKELVGEKVASHGGIIRARFVWFLNKLWRVWAASGSIFMSDSSDWSNPIFVGLGDNPSAITGLDGSLNICWERNGKLYYKKRTGDEWGIEKSILDNHPDISLPTSYDPSSVYKEPCLLVNNDNLWVFYVRRKDNQEEMFYRLSSQDFKFEYSIPSISGDKSDLCAYLAPDKKILLTWINRYNGISNVLFMFTTSIEKFDERAARRKSIPSDGISVPTDFLEFELIKL